MITVSPAGVKVADTSTGTSPVTHTALVEVNSASTHDNVTPSTVQRENFYANMNCVILDEAKVTFGDNVFIAPSCGFYTAGHPLDVEQRNRGLEYARPIRVGNNVWIGAQVCVLPGVTIGDNTVIGAGSVVNRDIPANVIAAGNPCRVIREITEEDKTKYLL